MPFPQKMRKDIAIMSTKGDNWKYMVNIAIDKHMDKAYFINICCLTLSF